MLKVRLTTLYFSFRRALGMLPAIAFTGSILTCFAHVATPWQSQDDGIAIATKQAQELPKQT